MTRPLPTRVWCIARKTQTFAKIGIFSIHLLKVFSFHSLSQISFMFLNFNARDFNFNLVDCSYIQSCNLLRYVCDLSMCKTTPVWFVIINNFPCFYRASCCSCLNWIFWWLYCTLGKLGSRCTNQTVYVLMIKCNHRHNKLYQLHFLTIQVINSDGSLLCKGTGEGYCMWPSPYICKETVSGFEPMTDRSQRAALMLC